jgi:hypothetical protein
MYVCTSEEIGGFFALTQVPGCEHVFLGSLINQALGPILQLE